MARPGGSKYQIIDDADSRLLTPDAQGKDVISNQSSLSATLIAVYNTGLVVPESLILMLSFFLSLFSFELSFFTVLPPAKYDLGDWGEWKECSGPAIAITPGPLVAPPDKRK